MAGEIEYYWAGGGHAVRTRRFSVPSFIRIGLPLTSLVALVMAACGADSGGGFGTGAASGTGAVGGSTSGGSGGINLGGTSGSGIDGGGGTGGLDLDAGCAAETHQGELIPANLLFVIDRSGSMNCNLPADGQSTAECESFPAPKDATKPTKWALTRDALKLAIDNLQAAGNTAAGLDVFPNEGSECLVDSNPNIDVLDLSNTQKVALHTFLDNVTPQGKTPLAGATILAYAHLLEKLKQGGLGGNKFVVLLTDGFETCKPDEIPKLLQQDVPNAALLGIRTFVIGVPGSEDGRALLSQIAYTGGTAKSPTCVHDPLPNNVGDCHFDMTKSQNFSQDLQAALNAISGTVLSCELDMPTPKGGLPDYNNVKVLIGGDEIASAPGSCDSGNGWQYNQDKTKIFLCGTACDAAKQPNATVQIYVPCGIQ
jgi:hypothetical protein